MKANLPQKEPMMLDAWEKSGLYGKMTDRNKGKEKFVLHDGPPYANGHIHLGTAMNKILKDIVIKYKNMSGFDAPYVPGWDCHGLPIEYQLMKDLGKNKATVDKVEFRKKAAQYALKFMGIQRDEFKRLGCLGEWENPYLTLANEYESVIISVFRELLKDGYIYRKLKPVYWCASCETALADAEVEYADHSSPSIFVKFKVLRPTQALPASSLKLPTYVVIWTTTPWTLPANVALAFKPEIDYVAASTSGETYIVAEARLDHFKKVTGITDFEILWRGKGAQLEGIICGNPIVDRESVGVLADFVSLEDGTGVVHIAPGHGEEDYSVGLKYNLPVIAPVDERGRFTEEVPAFKGENVFAANEKIIEFLKGKNLLISGFDITHSYPHCWRCKRPIIFRATKQWFLSVEKDGLRKRLLDTINEVNWIPQYGRNRITGMVEVRPDWCLSRQRYWGTPLPIIYCADCDEPVTDDAVLGKIEDIVKRGGSNAYLETPADAILPAGAKCTGCGGTNFKKSDDILDVWFDSGVSSFAVLGTRQQLRVPADLYLEGSDQHRGWFQTSLIPSVALRSAAPYKTVLTHGFVVDGEGKKMSKSLGNVIAPQDVIKKYGAEILRLWVSSENYQEDVRLSDEILSHLIDAYRKIRNTLRFLLGNTGDFLPDDRVSFNELMDVDKWILSKFNRLIGEVDKCYQRYEFHKVFHLVYNFCVVELSAFYFDIVKDRLYTYNKKSRERLSAQTALETIFTGLVPLLAPILSFTAEEAYLEYSKRSAAAGEKGNPQPESVFLSEMPVPNKDLISDEIEEKFSAIISIREFVLKLLEEQRKAGVIGNSLEAKVTLYTADASKKKFLEDNVKNLMQVFLVSQAEIAESSFAGAKDESLGIEAKVEHAPGKKCARCWMWFEDVGIDQSHPEICSKCVKNILS
jgi:isoleucyl-tRNA synthetase